jgi:hypothetical protein
MMKTLVVAVCVLVGGCSIALQKKPLESTFGYADQDCDAESKYWIADAVIAGLASAAVVGGRVYADSAPESETAGYTIAGAAAILAVVHVASAGNGRSWNTACRAYLAERAARTATL